MNTLEIATADEVDQCDYVVCMRLTQPLLLPDNVICACCKCGEAIQHRPHIPSAPTICFECIKPRMDREIAKGELHLMIPPKTAGEVRDFLRKKNAN